MAALLKQFGGLNRRAANVASVQAFARPFAAHPVTAAVDPEDSFTKWTTPEFKQFTHAGILAAPTTKVRPLPPHANPPPPHRRVTPTVPAGASCRAIEGHFRVWERRLARGSQGTRFQICFAHL